MMLNLNNYLIKLREKGENMINFKDIDELLQYMFGKLDTSTLVSVVADKKLTVEIMKELLIYDDVILDLCEIDNFEYDKEYLISLCNNDDPDFCHVCIEQMFNYETKKYRATDGYVLFYEDASSKAQIDVTENEFCDVCGYDWFKLGEDDNEYAKDLEIDYQTDEENDTHGFTVSKTDENSSFVYSFYSSEKLDKNDIIDMIRNIDF